MRAATWSNIDDYSFPRCLSFPPIPLFTFKLDRNGKPRVKFHPVIEYIVGEGVNVFINARDTRK